MNKQTSNSHRHETIAKMQTEEFDVLIIGGGVTGAGIAMDAASRGLKTALVEMQDFSGGTSSRSTKMIHGGLRYLKSFEIKIVSQVGRERAIVYENGPHVTTPQWLILPIYKNGTFGKFSSSIGLRVYDMLARVKKDERKSMLTVKETLQAEPKFKQEGLLGAGRFVEYRSDDARLTIEVMKEAKTQGATVLNYTKVEEFLYTDEKIVGIKVVDQLNGESYEIHGKKIVNAAGPWVNTVREKDLPLDNKKLHLTKGVHIVFDQSVFPLKQTIYFDTPDGRMVLAIPRDGKTYIGTTDTDYAGDLKNPKTTEQDQNYLLDAIHFIFPDLEISQSDIESSWAGLRPLIQEEGKDASEISRKDEIWKSKTGLITIAGGKLTGYRKMAETIVDLITSEYQKEDDKIYSPCNTKNMPISGGHVGGSKRFEAYKYSKVRLGMDHGLSKEVAYSLVQNYGSNIDRIFALIENYKTDAEEFGMPVDIYAQVVYSIEDEFTCTPVDFFWRRTGALLFDIAWVHKWKELVIDLMSEKLEWSIEQKKDFTADLDKHLENATVVSEEE
ncbi:FAD-dependent oxidoreductase [Sporosarcina siberiensis]|uniref:Glycerol-3-phosphate dehydrogenase n=1 Tax=Sporosarcina siberiensis TaxID=1365606 RepID=A0ABW4SJ66_9BACL